MVRSTAAVLAASILLFTSGTALGEEEDEPGGPKYPEYVVAGAISLAAAGGLAVGGAVATFDESPRTATGLLGLGTVAAGVGLPFVLLGAADETPESSFRMSTGVAIATPGMLSLGIGGTIWAAQAAGPDDVKPALPLSLVIGGAVATVMGIVVWATGAGHDDSADRGVAARVELGPGGASLRGTF
jgi:hypothetical protein